MGRNRFVVFVDEDVMDHIHGVLPDHGDARRALILVCNEKTPKMHYGAKLEICDTVEYDGVPRTVLANVTWFTDPLHDVDPDGFYELLVGFKPYYGLTTGGGGVHIGRIEGVVGGVMTFAGGDIKYK